MDARGERGWREGAIGVNTRRSRDGERTGGRDCGVPGKEGGVQEGGRS